MPSSIVFANEKCAFRINIWHSVSSDVYNMILIVYFTLAARFTKDENDLIGTLVGSNVLLPFRDLGLFK